MSRFFCVVVVALAACSTPSSPELTPGNVELIEVASCDRQWTGVAVSPRGRIFVNFPRWSDSVPISVGELHPDGRVTPYPDTGWNGWTPSLAPRDHFVCVQSVTVDDAGSLWILDPANPQFRGVVAGGPKLLKVDLDGDRVERVYRFDSSVAPSASYLNDVRVDTQRGVAYMTDSGVGAIVVLDLDSAQARRVLLGHVSTRSEDITLVIDGKPWKLPDGSRPEVHADGIALDDEREYLYYQPLTGRHLYRIPTRVLRDEALDAKSVENAVELLGETGSSDGLLYGHGGSVYLSSLEHGAIRRYLPGGRVETVVEDSLIRWPDSFARGPDGSVYFTVAQIHVPPAERGPFRLLRIVPVP